EYACRAGARTSRSYGASGDLLGRYARYHATSQDHAWPCGSLLPNELGLFDMLGNVIEWCQEAARIYQTDSTGKAIDDMNTNLLVDKRTLRPRRAGSFLYPPANGRSASRYWIAPAYRFTAYGFRPSRTYY